jgi:RNA polymerase sigma-70 factor (sigma-E family)
MTFEEFLGARLESLLRYATVLTCDPHLAQDVVQECLLRAQVRWSRIGAMDGPEQYVRRMILNEFLSWRRRRSTSSTVSLDPARLPELAPVTTAAEEQVDDREQLLRLIAALPPRQRAVIALRYMEDLDDADIARMLGCRASTVRSQASRALGTLRRGMPDSTLSPSGGAR